MSIATDAATGQRVASHDGKSPGVSAYIKRWLDDGRVLIVLSNVNSGLVQHLAPLADSDWFYMATRGDRIRFRYGGDGDVTGLEYDWGGGVEFCPRLAGSNTNAYRQ